MILFDNLKIWQNEINFKCSSAKDKKFFCGTLANKRLSIVCERKGRQGLPMTPRKAKQLNNKTTMLQWHSAEQTIKYRL